MNPQISLTKNKKLFPKYTWNKGREINKSPNIFDRKGIEKDDNPHIIGKRRKKKWSPKYPWKKEKKKMPEHGLKQTNFIQTLKSLYIYSFTTFQPIHSSSIIVFSEILRQKWQLLYQSAWFLTPSSQWYKVTHSHINIKVHTKANIAQFIQIMLGVRICKPLLMLRVMRKCYNPVGKFVQS